MDAEIRCFIELEVQNGTKEVCREFKLEAVRFVKERGVNVAQTLWNLDVHLKVLLWH